MKGACAAAAAWWVVMTFGFVLLFPLLAPLFLAALRGLLSFLNSIGS